MPVNEGPAIKFDKHTEEPMLNPIKKLMDELDRLNIGISPFVDLLGHGAKIGFPTGVKQFNCHSSDDFPELAAKIAELGKTIRFYRMFIPSKGILAVHTFMAHNVWARYIASYDCPTDSVQGRWDVLVEAV